MFAQSKPTLFTDNRSKQAQVAEFLLNRVENIVRKGDNAGYQHFLLYPQCFQIVPFPRFSKIRDCFANAHSYYLNCPTKFKALLKLEKVDRTTSNHVPQTRNRKKEYTT